MLSIDRLGNTVVHKPADHLTKYEGVEGQPSSRNHSADDPHQHHENVAALGETVLHARFCAEQNQLHAVFFKDDSGTYESPGSNQSVFMLRVLFFFCSVEYCMTAACTLLQASRLTVFPGLLG